MINSQISVKKKTSNKNILPSFIIAGAARSGTTFLYSLLDYHPDVYLAKPISPEPKFFLVDEEYRKGLVYYSNKYFSSAINFCAIGEKSTSYLENPIVAERIYKNLPFVKLIFILRDPIDRAFSNYKWSCQNGLENFSFSQALTRELTNKINYSDKYKYSRPLSYIERGYYLKLLTPFLDLFTSKQIKIILFDDVIAGKINLLDELFGFLQIETNIFPVNNIGFNNKINTTNNKQQITEKDFNTLREIYYEENKKLFSLFNLNCDSWNYSWEERQEKNKNIEHS